MRGTTLKPTTTNAGEVSRDCNVKTLFQPESPLFPSPSPPISRGKKAPPPKKKGGGNGIWPTFVSRRLHMITTFTRPIHMVILTAALVCVLVCVLATFLTRFFPAPGPGVGGYTLLRAAFHSSHRNIRVDRDFFFTLLDVGYHSSRPRAKPRTQEKSKSRGCPPAPRSGGKEEWSGSRTGGLPGLG